MIRNLGLFYVIVIIMAMRDRLYTLLLCTTILTLSTQLVPNRKSQLLPSPIALELSPNQQTAAAYNTTHIAIYNALTSSQIELLEPLSPTVSLEFSRNSSLLAISSADGNTDVYRVSGQGQGLERVGGYKRRGGNQEAVIADTCFTANQEYLAIVHTDGIIVGWSLSGLVATGYFTPGKPTKITCSSSSPSEFTISSQTPSLQSFLINPQTLTIQPKPITYNLLNLTKINHIVIHNNDLYVVGDSNAVYRYAGPGFEVEVFYQGFGEIFKVQFGRAGAGSGELMAIVNGTHLVVNLEVKEKGNGLDWDKTYFETNQKKFSLSVLGSRLLYLQSSGSARFLSSCPEGQYLNTQNKCILCNSQCSVCFSDSNSCFECKKKSFLSVQTCLKCNPNCEECTNALSCSACSDPEAVPETLCECKKGYTLVDETCKRGVEFWVWGISVGIATLVLILIAVVNIVVMKRREKQRKGLINEDYQ